MHLRQESDCSRHSNGKDGEEGFAGCNLVARKGSVAVFELDE
jgi:hypothetical protein